MYISLKVATTPSALSTRCKVPEQRSKKDSKMSSRRSTRHSYSRPPDDHGRDRSRRNGSEGGFGTGMPVSTARDSLELARDRVPSLPTADRQSSRSSRSTRPRAEELSRARTNAASTTRSSAHPLAQRDRTERPRLGTPAGDRLMRRVDLELARHPATPPDVTGRYSYDPETEREREVRRQHPEILAARLDVIESRHASEVAHRDRIRIESLNRSFRQMVLGGEHRSSSSRTEGTTGRRSISTRHDAQEGSRRTTGQRNRPSDDSSARSSRRFPRDSRLHRT
jgi:hypothetical protein